MPKDTETTEKKPITPEEIEAIAAKTPKVGRPGTIVGEGLAADYVPFSPEFYMDVESRRKEPEFGPEYQLHELWPTESITVTVNGVSFALFAGRKCWLPTPHFLVYQERLRILRENHEKWSPPEGGPKPMVVYRIDGPWQKTPIE